MLGTGTRMGPSQMETCSHEKWLSMGHPFLPRIYHSIRFCYRIRELSSLICSSHIGFRRPTRCPSRRKLQSPCSSDIRHHLRKSQHPSPKSQVGLSVTSCALTSTVSNGGPTRNCNHSHEFTHPQSTEASQSWRFNAAQTDVCAVLGESIHCQVLPLLCS